MNQPQLKEALTRVAGGRRIAPWWWAAGAVAAIILIVSALQAAQPQPSPLPAGLLPDSRPASMGGLLAGMVVKLVAVLGLIYGSLYLLRRWQVGLGAPAARRLKLLESTRLGPRQALHVVRAGEQVLLIGATDHGVTLLAELEADLPAETAAAPPPFAAALARWMPQPAERPAP